MLIGDVTGRGLHAATVMGKMRSAANALALTGMPPQQLMQSLELVARDIPDQLITCCYLVIDPYAGELSICSAGHLPALLVSPDSTVCQLPAGINPPLGIGDVPHRQAIVPVQLGATIVLYTDGLIERHDRDIDEQVTALESQLHLVFGGDPGLDQAAEAILAAFRSGAADKPDDVALLLAKVPDGPLSR